jgi:excisionase family DNA binding protein
MSTQKMQLRPLLTIGDTADKLRVSPQTVRRLIDLGEIATVRIGERAVRIERGALESLIKRGREPLEPKPQRIDPAELGWR